VRHSSAADDGNGKHCSLSCNTACHAICGRMRGQHDLVRTAGQSEGGERIGWRTLGKALAHPQTPGYRDDRPVCAGDGRQL